MAVDSPGPIDPVAILKDIDRTAAPQPDDDARPASARSASAESAGLSTEARVVAELDAALEIANRSPAVREELVADVKARLQDPNYLSATVIDRIAERIQDRFGT